jgi:thymidylate kinase
MQGHLNSIIKYQKYSSLRKDLVLLRESDLFDEKYYTVYVSRLKKQKIDPRLHYLLHGGFVGRDPGPNFDSSWYLEAYPDVRKAGINPLIHYLRSGKVEKRARYSEQKGLLIEFVGIPGSGKSTLYGQLNRLLGERLGYRPGPRDLWMRMADEIRFQAVQGGAYQSLVRFILENKTFTNAVLQDQTNFLEETSSILSDKNSLLPYFLSLCAFYQSTKEDHTKNWCLFDEGFFYYLFQHFTQNGSKLSQTINETMPKIDVLIHLNTDVELCITRMKSRKQGIPIPYRRLSEDDLQRTLTQLNDNIKMGLEVIKDHPTKIIYIDGAASVNDALSLITSTLEPRLASQR